MKFIPKRYVIKIPSEISFLYFEKQEQLLILNDVKKVLINLPVKLKILNNKNCVIISNIPFGEIANKSNKFKKSLQGSTYFFIKKLLKNFKILSYKKLNLIGIGYKVFEVAHKNTAQKLLHFKLGYSHSIYYKVPDNLSIQIRNSNKLFISGTNPDFVTKTASIIKSYKVPEPYKGKGILYFDESLTLKEGKKI